MSNPNYVTLVFRCFDCGEEFATEEYPADSMQVLIGTCVSGAFERLDGAHEIPSHCDACTKKEGIPTPLPGKAKGSFPMCGCGRGPELAEDIPVCFDCLHGHEPGHEPAAEPDDDDGIEDLYDYVPCCEQDAYVYMENGDAVCQGCGTVETAEQREREEKLRVRYGI